VGAGQLPVAVMAALAAVAAVAAMDAVAAVPAVLAVLAALTLCKQITGASGPHLLPPGLRLLVGPAGLALAAATKPGLPAAAGISLRCAVGAIGSEASRRGVPVIQRWSLRQRAVTLLPPLLLLPLLLPLLSQLLRWCCY
jgi:hypothetical protein